jgi:hypothetical protein
MLQLQSFVAVCTLVLLYTYKCSSLTLYAVPL